ncbi:MAG: DUF2309 domain-containing protein [Halothiobacillus sp. 14-56-357]|jgi:uncharacterized protein YbcC (UPF0753/DUF2309 family)|uniref:DUF2309 domain-containing protein n=2 Tax=Pseudomonadota TaxID=1224 RepID=UPI000BD046E4|nr:DUF2309 domain-containing protein [Halothiobacillus sp. 15-55-196]OZB37570.1 MAG: DUF2309 domain-containing protein [Halothiobacillus sp. 15-55-196]OZB55765.1 MAG: DUF2309 domain-containing protein [Halothiobacillus sp. 14-56-357]
MSKLPLGKRLKIRSMVHMAAEPIPNFWPMRTFIHHNPLHGLEHLPFEQAVRQGEKLFHARGFLPRADYQRYNKEGRVDQNSIKRDIADFVSKQETLNGLDLASLLSDLMCSVKNKVTRTRALADHNDVFQALHGKQLENAETFDLKALTQRLCAQFSPERPLYEAIDLLFGTQMGTTLDELVIKSCLDFFDEGQSTIQMPGRHQGLFAAWTALAKRNLRLFLRGMHIKQILDQDDTPEGIIAYILDELGIEETHWDGLITRELTRLHGWAGFIRWRSSSKHYYWAEQYPGDLIDFLAIRLVLGLALIREHSRQKRTPMTAKVLQEYIEGHTAECYLRQAYYGGCILPAFAHDVDDALSHKKPQKINTILPGYLRQQRQFEATRQADALRDLASKAGQTDALMAMDAPQIKQLMTLIEAFENEEGMIWLRAMESVYRREIINQIQLHAPHKKDKRPFAQALFCIDVRSEPIRRNLETVGEYQTYGIAGFFGVPVSYIGLGKGSEVNLCPVVITPKNLVLEVPVGATSIETDFYSSASHVLHEMKSSILSPYFTVEAAGLLFGFDMIGKTIAPRRYTKIRNHIEPKAQATRLLVDKLTREQADSIVRSLQRTMIVRAIHQEFGIEREAVTDAMIRELREAAMDNHHEQTEFARRFALSPTAETQFIAGLKKDYKINRSFVSMQMERLARIGFSLDEQVFYVEKALKSIGLAENFSRFVLLTGHGSTSDNNPYESALDCGACGGSHGSVSARVLAHMANKPEVRRRLSEQGINIPDDTWFVSVMHNTTTDQLILQDLDLLPNSHLVYLERLRNGLRAATRLTAAERLPALEDHPSPNIDTVKAQKRIERNASDWTQVRPEWGLARNASVVAGGRHLTEGANLNGRTFLQSYDYRLDPKGRHLENILSNPLIIGQWINLEHYFSAVDNEHFGSGSKAYHNVAGRFGVVTGNLSDLRTGLPAQSVLKDGRPYHEPIRLLAIVEAPAAFTLEVAGRLPKVMSLITNGWITVVVVDPETGDRLFYDRGEWYNLNDDPQYSPSVKPLLEEELSA